MSDNQNISLHKTDIKYEDKCIFCKISQGKEDNEIIYEDDEYSVFRDIRPAATHHYLIIPKNHYKNVLSLEEKEISRITDMVKIGEKLLADKNVALSTARMGFHWPPFYTVGHLHLHVIAPEQEISFIGRAIFKTNCFWFVNPDTAITKLRARNK